MHNGIDWYTKVTFCFDYYFPEGEANCRHCDFCTYSETYNTYKCRLTNEYIEKNRLNNRGRACPAIFDAETPF